MGVAAIVTDGGIINGHGRVSRRTPMHRRGGATEYVLCDQSGRRIGTIMFPSRTIQLGVLAPTVLLRR